MPEIVRTASLVPDDRREGFLPALFGMPLLIIAENTVYSFMDRLSPHDYGGGFWDFYEYRGKPLFLAPTSRPRLRIEGEITGFRGEVSADAAGILATLLALSHLSIRYESELLAQRYYRLRVYSLRHPEASEISQVLD
ncbi:antirestriction protein [Nitratireductor sp. L15S-10]|uniref:antirestriction protein n=1 Tax=Nitratireductor sp. L15S-10 TaxID=3034028 RepID=UPI0038573305